MENFKYKVMVCGGTGCTSSNAELIIDTFRAEAKKHGIDGEVKVVRTGCFGLCELGPIVIINPDGAFYCRLEVENVPKIVEEHLVNGRAVKELLYQETVQGDEIIAYNETGFYKKQQRVTLKNCGVIDPDEIDDYIEVGGYQAIQKVLKEKSPQEVIDIVKESGLRGRGGGGFPTGMKWQFTKNYEDDTKYVLCNADEGDPGAFMDRSILEGDPHCLVEAMSIAGYAIGSKQGYVYVRAEYPIAVKRLQNAIEVARERGMLGDNLFGTDFSFDLEIRLGAGAFVCGEETALIHSIEGFRGEPTSKPPFPAESGLWEKPTLINNVETYANIPDIIIKGADWFAGLGTEKSKGTKVFALGGKIKNTGLIEIPMGTTLREVVFEIGGGIPNGRKFKAAQTGGPSGGCLPEQFLDIKIDYDSLLEVGSMMGSGGLIVMDDSNCMVDIAKFFLEFTVDESCGKCTACRVGTMRLYELLEKISKGEADMRDLTNLEELCHIVKSSSLCGLGQTAPNPILSTLEYFRDEYVAHVVDKRCPAGVCTDLLTYRVIEDKCVGCTVCAKKCPVDAITGGRKEIHYIDPEKCIKCGICEEACKFDAITR